MLLSALLVLPSLVTLVRSAPSAQLYLSPSSLSTKQSESISLNSHQVNSVLAHHLGVSAYEPLPITNHADKVWEEILTTGGWGEGDKLVVVLECPSAGCDGKSPLSPLLPLQRSLTHH
jgi:hypothetical protein